MAAWLRNAFIAVLVTGAAWAALVLYWRSAPTLPSTTAMVSIMAALPLLLLGGAWWGKRMLALAPAPAPAPVSAPAPPGPPPALPAPAILAASLRMPHAACAEQLLAVLARGGARASLDADLTGDDGYPIMSARATAADDQDAREQQLLWIERHGTHAGELQDEHLRALLLASAVAAELTGFALESFMKHQQDAPALQLALLLPPSWDVALCRTAADLLRQSLVDCGWPASRLTVATLGELAEVLPGGARHAPLTLLLACASHVGEASVNQWSADLTLFSASEQQGLIPGEAAAAVLLDGAAAAPGAMPAPRLWQASALRSASADAERRPDGTLLHTLATRVLADAAVPIASVGAVVADTGHRTARTMELLAMVRALCPHLDPGSDVQAIGTASGSCAQAGMLAALAVAAAQADLLKAPVLCVANEDAFRRCVMLVQPGAHWT